MSEKPRRKWFRFHLLTAVLLSLTAGGLLLFNMRLYNVGRGFSTAQGWPFPWAETLNPVDHINWTTEQQQLYFTPQLKPVGMVVDALVGLGILLTVSVASEFYTRRREAPKP